MSLTGSSNGVEMDGLCNARARFSFVLHGAWNSLEMQWMMSCRIYELPLRWTGLHEVRCLVISTMRCAGICISTSTWTWTQTRAVWNTGLIKVHRYFEYICNW